MLHLLIPATMRKVMVKLEAILEMRLKMTATNHLLLKQIAWSRRVSLPIKERQLPGKKNQPSQDWQQRMLAFESRNSVYFMLL